MAVAVAAFHQGFESGIDGWITDTTPGEEGWCGEIEHRDASSGPMEPSEGDGYALLRIVVCNEYWQETFGTEETGPYTPGAGYPRAWPDAGYAIEMDVYLDPSARTGFTLATSVVILEPVDPGPAIRYFFTEVTAEEGALSVLGQNVTEAGWYTLRNTFADENGALMVHGELLREGDVVAAAPLTTTAFSGEAASSFDVSALGTGYVWIVSVAEGTELAIDEVRGRVLD